MDFDDKDLAIIGIVVVLVMPKDIALQMADKLATVWGSLAGGLAGIATGRNKS